MKKIATGLLIGNKPLAIQSFEKALELDPGAANTAAKLKKLKS